MSGGLWNSQIWVFLSQRVQTQGPPLNDVGNFFGFFTPKSIFIFKIQLELSEIDTYSIQNIRFCASGLETP